MKNIRVLALALGVLVCLVTLFIRVPLPSRGYFNVGDVAVVFAGLTLGRALGKGVPGFLWAAAVAGLGSATADILSGFAVFAPLTFAAKGLEGGLAAIAARFEGPGRWIWVALGGGAMVVSYFIGEALLPSIGVQGALAEIIPNLIQATGGTGLGIGAFALLERTGFLKTPNSPD